MDGYKTFMINGVLCWLEYETGIWHPVIAGGDFSSDVDFPEPTQTETELEQMQLDILQDERDTWEALEPYYLEQYGLVKQTDPETGEISYTKTEEQAALDATNKEIEATSAERELAALSGELEVDPTVEADIQKGLDELKASLTAKLGSGAEGSEAWNRAIAAYESEAEALRYGVRTGEISNYEAISNIAATNEANTASGLSNIVNPYATTASGVSAAQDSEQEESLTAASLSSQEDQASISAIGSAIGIGAGIIA